MEETENLGNFKASLSFLSGLNSDNYCYTERIANSFETIAFILNLANPSLSNGWRKLADVSTKIDKATKDLVTDFSKDVNEFFEKTSSNEYKVAQAVDSATQKAEDILAGLNLQ